MPQPTLAQLGAAIRVFRVGRSLSIEALAGEAGLQTSTVSGIELGKGNPTWKTLSKIVDVLDVEIVDLVRLALKQRDHGTKPSPTGEEARPAQR